MKYVGLLLKTPLAYKLQHGNVLGIFISKGDIMAVFNIIYSVQYDQNLALTTPKNLEENIFLEKFEVN